MSNRVENISALMEPASEIREIGGHDLIELRDDVRLDDIKDERGGIFLATGVMKKAFANVVKSGSADLLRGYANGAMGATKLTVGLAVRSPELAMAGIAQKALGEMQKFVGEAKKANS